MKHKVAELEGALLDAAVALAEGWQPMPHGEGWYVPSFIAVRDERIDTTTFEPRPRPWSTDWRYGGPIIDRAGIAIMPGPTPDAEGRIWWRALIVGSSQRQDGPTHLIAACRAFVASKFGDEVELEGV